MSLFGALNTALSGLTSQSAALGNISDNIANSQTVGFKGVDTSFEDYLTTSNATNNTPGAVVAQPSYLNAVQGSITQSDNPLALAIDGPGFFQVSENTGSSPLDPAFSELPYYTRAGDFSLNASGYLVNSAGYYLNGWPVSSTTGELSTAAPTPIQISESVYKPVATSTATVAANLPPDTGGTTADAVTTNINVYDAQGTSHQLTLTFTPTGVATNAWTLAVTDDSGNTIGTGTVGFGANGTLGFVTQGGTTINSSGATGSMTLSTVYENAAGNGTQNITLDLGTIDGSGGLTQFAGSAFQLRSTTQNGVAAGNFSSVTTTTSGAVMVNYDNGQSVEVAQVPVVTFANPDALQRQNGSAFTYTSAAGNTLTQSAGIGGAGTLVTGSVEQSNVDLATQFSALIVAQEAYSANAKLVTTASDMLQTTLDMKR